VPLPGSGRSDAVVNIPGLEAMMVVVRSIDDSRVLIPVIVYVSKYHLSQTLNLFGFITYITLITKNHGNRTKEVVTR